MFQKPMNMYLYRLPTTSAQCTSVLYGLIYGTLHHYFWQNSKRDPGSTTQLTSYFNDSSKHMAAPCTAASLGSISDQLACLPVRSV
jgi:hypothetical protein